MKPLLINSEIAFRSNRKPFSFVRATMEEVVTASPRIFRSQADYSLFTRLGEGELLKCRNGVLGVAHVIKGDLLVIERDHPAVYEAEYQKWLTDTDTFSLPDVILCSPNISHSNENLAIHAVLQTEGEFLKLFAEATERFQFLDMKNDDEVFATERTFFYTLDQELLVYQGDTLLKVMLTKTKIDTLEHLTAFKADLAAFYAWAKENIPTTLQEA